MFLSFSLNFLMFGMKFEILFTVNLIVYKLSFVLGRCIDIFLWSQDGHYVSILSCLINKGSRSPLCRVTGLLLGIRGIYSNFIFLGGVVWRSRCTCVYFQVVGGSTLFFFVA